MHRSRECSSHHRTGNRSWGRDGRMSLQLFRVFRLFRLYRGRRGEVLERRRNSLGGAAVAELGQATTQITPQEVPLDSLNHEL